MLSRMYYEAFAKIIAESSGLEDLKRNLSAFFMEDNPRFDAFRFFKRIKELKAKKLAEVI